MKKLLVVGLALGALVSPAVAADMRVKALPPPPVAVTSWTGCYIGGSMGSDWARSGWTYRNDNPYSSVGPGAPIPAPDNGFNDMTSWIAGGQVGCNYEFRSHLVAGIEVSGFGSDLNQTNSNSFQVFAPGSIQTVTTNIKSLYTVTGRLGYAFSPGWLGYAKAGFASARIDTSGQTNPPLPGFVLNWSTSQWHDGYVVGVGAERQLTKNITLGAEYNYIGLDTKDHIGAVSGGIIGPANQVVHSVNGNIQSVMVRVNYLFGIGR